MWRVVGLAGCLAGGPVHAAVVPAAGPACVADRVESCLATMKNVFATPELTKQYCMKAAQKACEPETRDDN